MQAMQIIEWGKPLETREYPDPEPKGEERFPASGSSRERFARGGVAMEDLD